MGKRSGKKSVFSLFLRKSRSAFRRIELKPLVSMASEEVVVPVGGKGVKKKAGARLWMRFDRTGNSEVVELQKNTIIKMASIPARDLRILGPVFSQSSNILAREKAIVVNLEFIKAIVTAEEVLLLDPLAHEVLPFVEQLRHQIYLKSPYKLHESGLVDLQRDEGESELPFEFQVLEIALEFVCSYLDSSVSDLERNAYPVLDELAMNVSTKNLERVRSLKSNLTRLLARVQKVRDEIEHLLDDAEDMAQLYLTRKQIQNQQLEALVASATSNRCGTIAAPNLAVLSSRVQRSASITSFRSDANNVEDLEMLLEAYFMQLEGTRNKILSVREYIDDTEDYVIIQLDNQRNELIQLQMVLSILSFAIAIATLITGLLSMNIPCQLYNFDHIFTPVAAGIAGCSFSIFLIILGYARWKKLLA